MDRQDLDRAYGRLVSIKQNLPSGDVKDLIVRDYEDVLTALERAAGYSLVEFRVPNEILKPRLVSTQFDDFGDVQERRYSSETYCDGALFRIKLDAVLNFFILQSGNAEKRPIGFRPQ